MRITFCSKRGFKCVTFAVVQSVFGEFMKPRS